MFTTTRTQTVNPSSGDTCIQAVRSLQEAGVTIPKATLKALEDLQERRSHIRTMKAEINPDEAARAAAKALADGTGTITDVLNGAGASTLLDKKHGGAFARIFDKALTFSSIHIIDELRELGDGWITDVMRPTVTQHLATILEAHNANTPAEPTRNPRELDYLKHVPGVSEATEALRTIYGTASLFRGYGIIPSKYRREDEYQFATPYPSDRNYGDGIEPNNLTWLIWADQRGVTPGIYTEADITERYAA